MSDKRSNGWGWLGLILVAAMFGAGILYQREGGKLFGLKEVREGTEPQQVHQRTDQVESLVGDEQRNGDSPAAAASTGQMDATSGNLNQEPLPPAKPPERRVSRSTPGTVNVQGERPFRSVAGALFPGSGGLWLYVDRKLVRYEYSRDFIGKTVQLVPGKYTIEACRQRLLPGHHSGGDLPFALEFESTQVSVEPGTEQTISLKLPDDHVFDGGPLYGGALIEDLSEDALRNWASKASTKMTLYEDDKLVKALKSQQDREPKTSPIELQIPEEYGGPREVNAAQVETIVTWIKWYYWGDWPILGVGIDLTLDKDLTPSEREVRRQLQELQATVVDKNKKDIDELNGLARMLEEAGP